MGEAYFNLKKKLEGLGYTSTLPVDAVPLVECILADLLQTTRSLQHYMDLSKEALMQRDSLMTEVEPYKCDNAKLIQDNNQLHREVMNVKEENLKIYKDTKRKIKTLTDELSRKEALITKLQHDLRDLSLRSLCADTLSSRNKSKRKDGGDCQVSKVCICNDQNFCPDTDKVALNKTINVLQCKINEYCDEIVVLKNQIENRNSEIVRLNMLLEGGRPSAAVSKDFPNEMSDGKIQKLIKQIKELEMSKEHFKRELENSLEKQHEAMLRALTLADKNKALQEELQKVDKLALKVEEDCNKRLSTMMNELNFLQTRIEGLTMKNSDLEKELSQPHSKASSLNTHLVRESLNAALREKEALQREIKDLVELNKTLQDKIFSLSEVNRSFQNRFNYDEVYNKDQPNTLIKDEIKCILEDERRKYETYIRNIQDKLNETMNLLKKQALKENHLNTNVNVSSDNNFIRDLHTKLCEGEQKILMLKKENDELRGKVESHNGFTECNNYKDIISHLNAENAELSKENIALTQQISQYKSLNLTSNDRTDCYKRDYHRLSAKLEDITKEMQILKKDKQEYCVRYKDAMDLVQKLKTDLNQRQNEIEHLNEENRSYKMTNRTGKASADQLKDECNFLREQIQKMQTDFIKEKTLASQIKNIQLESERTSAEIQGELLSAQKKLSLSKDTIENLERKCKELQSEIMTLRNEKANLIDNIKTMDKERDKLVIELDHKTENVGVLEHKLQTQTYDMNKLENEIAELKRKLSISKINEHKVIDFESQVGFLNGEILRLTQQYDTAIIENKHLQNSLTDANGMLKLTKIELEKSRKDVDSLKQQLQHYVAEIRRIEDLLSQKEAERSDMLEHFASLSVEANILENNNHSLESESASKTLQLQTYITKIQNLEEKVMDKENIIDSQSARIAAMTCKINTLENEIKLVTEEKCILEQNVSYLKKMCSNLQMNNINKDIGENDSELKLYENRIKSLTKAKANLETEKDDLRQNLMTTETLLSNARREIVELKLALQDATSETKSLQEHVSRLNSRDLDADKNLLSQEKLDLPIMLEETIEELSHEDDDSDSFSKIIKRHSKFTHSDTI